MILNTSELDVIHITFDEPNKEHNWANLQEIAPWSKRVDGVVGFDSAHKAAANASSTDYLITVDGDNTVHPKFFELELNIQDKHANSVLSWNSINPLNGLVYGNGGVKIWPKQYILDMQTHENSPTGKGHHSLDFCWADTYVQLNNVYSTTHITSSPLQAFRAGFREGCKMTLDRGELVNQVEDIERKMYAPNLTKMLVWGSIGRDVENGRAAILGTRVGMWYTNIHKGDLAIVRDYNAFGEFALSYINTTHSDVTLLDMMCCEYGKIIEQKTGISFLDFTSEQSAFFKRCQPRHPTFPNPMVTESSLL